MREGDSLGPYRILGKLGEGGMGEVYRATDTRLGRTVAIKVLAAEFAADAGRRKRLEQEARAVSALNHPHICALYDIGRELPSAQAEGGADAPPGPIDFLVMEYLQGQTLAERIAKGPLPVPQAIDLGAQIADALAAAHRAGIVHRDLKPANVMLVKTPEAGVTAKLLDFGLARLAAEVPGANGATVTAHTVAGLVAGTAPYMAPEQIEGRAVDARADLFAFGATLYEMVTGRRAFEGASPASVMAAILEREPRVASTLQPAIPPAIDRIIRRCLAKDPDARWQTAGDLADALRWVQETGGPDAATRGGPGASLSRRLRPRTILAAGFTLVAITAAVAWTVRSLSTPKTVAGMSLDLSPAEIGPVGYSFTPGSSRTAFAWSADGRTLVFSGIRGDTLKLYERHIGEAVAQPLEGTDGAQLPVVSPDGRWMAFWAGRKIRKIPFGGGPVVDLASDLGKPLGLAWDEAGNLFFGRASDSLIWTIAPDGTMKAVTTRRDGEVAHVLPSLLPGGEALLYTVRRRTWSWGDEEVVALTLATGEKKPLLTDAADARYVPTGHLVFMRRGALWAVGFDPERLALRGTPAVVLDSVAQALTGLGSAELTGAGQFAVSPAGALAWIRGSVVEYPDTALVTVDRRGAVTRLPAQPRPYGVSVRLAPDGRRLVVTTQTSATGGVWVYDIERTTLTPALLDTESTWVHWWPKDGRKLLIDRNQRGRGTFVSVPSDGSGQPLELMPSARLWASSFSPDGRQLILVRDVGNATDEVVRMNVEDRHARPETLIEAPEKPDNPEVSPDGRWIAYTSRKAGRSEVFVRPLAGPGAPVQVSVDGGGDPGWNPRGGELFFTGARTKDGTFWMTAAPFSPGTPPRIGIPRRLFEFETETLSFKCEPVRCYDVAPDGQSFYVVQRHMLIFPAPVKHLNYVPNWLDELRAKVGTQ